MHHAIAVGKELYLGLVWGMFIVFFQISAVIIYEYRHLGDLERGSSNGSVKILIDIAEYFHVSMDYLLLGRDPSRDQFQNELQAAIDHLEKIKGLL